MARLVSLIVLNHKSLGANPELSIYFVLNFYNEKATIRNRRRPGFFSRKYGVDFVRACPVKECVGLTHFQTKEIIIIYTAVIPCLPGVYTVCNARVGMALVPLQTVTSVVSRGRCLRCWSRVRRKNDV